MEGTSEPQLLLEAPKAKAHGNTKIPEKQELEQEAVPANIRAILDYGKEYRWQKGQSGNPAGRPPGKSMKEFTREFLWNMSEEARTTFLQSLNPELVWKMAEGNPHQSQDVQMSGVVTHQVVGMNVNKELKKVDGKLSPKL